MASRLPTVVRRSKFDKLVHHAVIVDRSAERDMTIGNKLA